MPVTLEWREIALRLALTVLAGTLIGLNQGEHGRPAGLRTTLLVCLAASVSMLQANLLLGTVGKASDSFITLDLMRLPLGILSGMGFIGAGAILRRDNLVLGVTTAATLWFTTVLGLCFGGGQLALGLIALTLGMIVLSGLKWVEQHMSRLQRATLTLVCGTDGPTEEAILANLRQEGYRIASRNFAYFARTGHQTFQYELHWHSRPSDLSPPPFLNQLSQHPGTRKIQWKPQVF